jgi:hypothetical protein
MSKVIILLNWVGSQIINYTINGRIEFLFTWRF